MTTKHREENLQFHVPPDRKLKLWAAWGGLILAGLLLGSMHGALVADLTEATGSLWTITFAGSWLLFVILLWALHAFVLRPLSGVKRDFRISQSGVHFGTKLLPFSECRGWQLFPEEAIKLHGPDWTLVWRQKHWPIVTLAQVFESWLDPAVLHRHQEALATRGGEVEYREPSGRVAYLVLCGVMLLGLGGMLVWIRSNDGVSLQLAIYTALALSGGVFAIVAGLRSGRFRGVRFTPSGLRPLDAHPSEEITWDQIERLEVSDHDLMVHAKDGRTIAISPRIENRRVLERVLRSRIQLRVA